MKEHHWIQVGEDSIRCSDCDCRFGGKWHSLPCGTSEEEFIAFANARQSEYLK